VSAAGDALASPPPFEWAAVVSFYVAVHFVNGYLFEAHDYVPPDHDNRAVLVRGDPTLRQCRSEYEQLWDHGFRARYWRVYRLTQEDARSLVEIDLAHVAAVVTGGLT
jgi:hypothetical protein